MNQKDSFQDRPLLKKSCLAFFFLFLFVTFVGKCLEIYQITLFRDLTINRFKFGEHTGRMLLLFVPVGIYLWYKKALSWSPLTLYEKLALGYLAFLLLHLFWAHFPRQARRGPAVFFYCLVCYFVIKYLVEHREDFQKVVMGFIFCSLVVAGVNLYKYHVLAIKVSWGWPGKTYVASLLALNLSICVFYIFCVRPKGKVKALVLASLLVSFLVVVASETRSTFVALPFSLVVVGFFYKPKILIPVLSGFAVAILLICTLYLPAGKRFKVFLPFLQKTAHQGSPLPGNKKSSPSQKIASKKQGRDPSLSFRLNQLWPASLEMISNNPFLGIGCHSFAKEASAKYKKKYNFFMIKTDSHCAYLQIAVSLGLVGLLMYLAFLIALFRLIIQNLSTLKNPLYRAFNLAFLSWLVCHILTEVVLYHYIKERFSLLFSLMVALVIHSRRLEEREGFEKKN